ncbi:hypothetical protein ACIGGE_10685 [Qipengyuania sp. NPDC077410]|uniref:hypothetical protein n=1 Tax=Qipengyuania sp. NPDC077410 TaxID=3364496 RepID=UPI0037C5E131
MAVVLHDNFNDGAAGDWVINRPGWVALPNSTGHTDKMRLTGSGTARTSSSYQRDNGAGLGADTGYSDHYLIIKPNFTLLNTYTYSALRASNVSSGATFLMCALFSHNGPQFRRYVDGSNQEFSPANALGTTVLPDDSFRFEIIGDVARAIRVRGDGSEVVEIDNFNVSALPPSNYAGITTWYSGHYDEVTIGNFEGSSGGNPTPNHGLLALF